jgi:UDP-4-amino-4,6-dideoxy-N-acetyl-beta-L-altrosamine transaminase
MPLIPYGTQWIDEEDIHSVVEALRSDYLTQGPAVASFEEAICAYTKAKYCVAVANATAGLHIAVKALGISPGMEGITSPNTFVASANSLLYNGLVPVFADIEGTSYNIDPREIEKKMTDKTKVIIPVHFAGRPCDMEQINLIARHHRVNVIEDAAHALGSNYKDGTKVGNCKYSDMTVFSFHPVKTITTGEGGAITTNDKALYDKLRLLRSHGITKDPNVLTETPGPWYYEMHDLGYNFRITDIQAALGITQLKKVEVFKQRRTEIIEQYTMGLSGLSGVITPMADNTSTCFHLYVVQIDFDKIGKTRAEVMERLKAKNIGTQVHYIPLHTQPYYKKNFAYRRGDYPVAERYYDHALTLPLYPKMSDDDVQYVIDSIKEIFR